MKVDRQVAGLWCHDVLEKLSDYMDSDLPVAERERVEAHLRGCDACARFGGDFAATVGALRRHLLAEVPELGGLRQRVRAAIAAKDD